jgi:hypothetical protein
LALILVFKKAKNMKSIKNIILMIFMALALGNCDESSFLEEKPLSVYTPENSLVTASDYQSAVNYLYNRVRFFLFDLYSSQNGRWSLMYGTDMAYMVYTTGLLNNYKTYMLPTIGEVLNVWRYTYIFINQANLILTRIEDADFDDEIKNRYRGQALCIRAFGYRLLANLYGGVPLFLEESVGIRRDAVRATREEVYNQCKTDLIEAISLLGNIDEVRDGEVSRQVAQHYLTEIYICLGDNDEAIKAATAVIEHPAMALMTRRFGTFAGQEGSPFSDLFKYNNQNRGSGNTESLWVSQFDYLNPGSNEAMLDRHAWAFLPQYWSNVITIDGVTASAFTNLTMEKGGFGNAFMKPTQHVAEEIWAAGDLRNAPYLIVRDLIIDNPASPAFGKWFVADGYCTEAQRYKGWYPSFMKTVSGYIPEEHYLRDHEGNPVKTALGEQAVTTAAPHSYHDNYICRLAETYLLRAEAYLNKGDKANAAKDINAVRSRSQAPPVDAADVDIDYILDERLRELTFEEFRMLTLCRMGKLVERTKKYNYSFNGLDGSPVESSGMSMEEYHNLWPIPYNEIERNTEAVLEQNPGYTN